MDGLDLRCGWGTGVDICGFGHQTGGHPGHKRIGLVDSGRKLVGTVHKTKIKEVMTGGLTGR